MYYGLNRTMCEVLKEMRDLLDNYGPNTNKVLRSLVEEVQVMGNRMEASLSDKKDLRHLKEKISEHREELRQLKSEIKTNEKLKELTK